MKKVKVGDVVRVTGNSNSNNYAVGHKYRVIDIGGNGSVRAESLDETFVGNNLAAVDFIVIGLDKNYFEEQITHYKSEIQKAETIIAWMKETGNEEFNDQEFKIWEALTAFESDSLSKTEKVKLIAKIIKG